MSITTHTTTDGLDSRSDVGAVTLHVADLDAQLRFYTEGVGLSVLAAEGDSAVLGRGTEPIVILQHSPQLRHAAAHSAGLFHTAILFDSQQALAKSVASVATHYPRAFTGSADHLVSEAFYFDDLEGNGVELYVDRPRSAWTWNNGLVHMDSLYLDPNAYLAQHLPQDGAAELNGGAAGAKDATLGHVHLKVGSTETARAFYEGVVGFDVSSKLGNQAIFFSVGGYHHHLAANTWDSRGALVRTPSLGLGEIDLVLPTTDAMGALRERLTAHGVAQQDDGRTLTFEDPWRNALRITVAGA